MLILLALAVVQMSPPPEPLAGRLRATIWDDLILNGAIGNGNEVAGRWMNYWGGGSDPPMLRILDLVCHGDAAVQHCRFGLLREGGVILVDGEQVPDRLTCSAPLERSAEEESGWNIPHMPPPAGGGHSLTTLECDWAPAD